MKKGYITGSDVQIGTSISEIRAALTKIDVSGMDVDCRYDLNNGAAMVRFKWQGQTYERRSIKQPNASKNMRVICLNLKQKVLDHLRGVELFGDSMRSYLQIEGAPGTPNASPSSTGTPHALDAYTTLQISPYATFEQCETAYKRQCKAWHPDRFQNDPEMQKQANENMAKINAAWATIKAERGKI